MALPTLTRVGMEWRTDGARRGVDVGTKEAAADLFRLLAEPGPYRRRWERASLVASPPGDIHQPAVCAVLADWLVEQGEISERDPAPARKLRDRVRRALAGEVLSPTTVRWFAGGFVFDSTDAERLAVLLSGSTGVRVLSGRYVGLAAASDHRRGYRTVSLSERHHLDADGIPDRHRTTQVIEAITDGVGTYRYLFDADALTVEVLQGGTCSGPIVKVDENLYGLTFELTRPLRRGETTILDYETRFAYPERPAPEFRRTVLDRVDNVDLLVQFHRDHLPSAAYFGSWTTLDGEPDTSEPIPVESDGSVHTYLARLDHAIVGFHWTW